MPRISKKWKKERKTTTNKSHHFYWKYGKSDKSDLFTNLFKATI